MAGKLRQVKAQYHVFPKVVGYIGDETNSPTITYHLIGGALYGVAAFFSANPIITKLDDLPDQKINQQLPTFQEIRKYVFATDLDNGGKVTIDTSAVDLDTADTYQVTATVTDRWGNTASVDLDVTINDVLPPTIVMSSAAVNIVHEAAYSGAGVTGSDDSDSSVPLKYYWSTDAPVELAAIGNLPTEGIAADGKVYIIDARDIYKSNGVDAYVNTGESDFTGFDTDVALGTKYYVVFTTTDDSGNIAEAATQVVTIVSDTAPVITVTGGTDTVEINGDAWVDAGATAVDQAGTSLTANIETLNPLDQTTLGTYDVEYTVQDLFGLSTTEVRTVTVEDTEIPVITLTDGDSTVEVSQSAGAFVEPGWSVADNSLEDLDEAVVLGGDAVDLTTIGSYTITYDVDDSSGNSAVQKSRTITVEDTTPPVIELVVGDNSADIYFNPDGDPAYVIQNGTWTDPGVDISDNSGEVLTATVGGDTVDTATLGEYVITYDAQDSSLNDAVQVTRTVIVVTELPE